MERSENRYVGICGIRLLDGEGRSALCWGQFPSAWSFLLDCSGLIKLFPRMFPPRLTSVDVVQSAPVDQITGALFMVRHAMFRTTNGFDERFFIFEEVDFSLRANRLLVPLSCRRQCCSSRCRRSNRVKAQRLFYSLRSRMQYVEKHFSKSQFSRSCSHRRH